MENKFSLKKYFNQLLKEDNTSLYSTNSSIQKPEDDDTMLGQLKSMEKFLGDENEESKTDEKSAAKQVSVVNNPIKKNIANLSQQYEKQKQKAIKATQDTLKQKEHDTQKNMDDKKKKTINNNKTITKSNISNSKGITNTPLTEAETPILNRNFSKLPIGLHSENEQQAHEPSLNNHVMTESEESHLVKFDTKTPRPFDVKFSERGFAVEGTRLSFETLEHAISKNYTITLNNGSGLVLDLVKMQKILKYKNRWFTSEQPQQAPQNGQPQL